MKKKLSIVVFSLLLVSGLRAQEASYEESVAWLKGKLEKFTYSRYSDVGVRDRWKLTTRYSYKLLSSDNCTLILEESYSQVTAQGNANNDIHRKTVVKFNLADIKSIVYDGTGQFYLIKTYNSDKKIYLDPDKNTRVTNEYKIYVSDLGEIKGQSERFTNAFMHATKTCGGGKEEKF